MSRDYEFPTEVEFPSLGPCCGCGCDDGVRTIAMLDRLCVMPGHGWGCAVCGIPSNGASVVLCDPCADKYEALGEQVLQWVCRGYPAEDGRITIEQAAPEGSFCHDVSKHQPGD